MTVQRNQQSLHDGPLQKPIRGRAAGHETSAAILHHIADAKTGRSASRAPQTPVGRSRLPDPLQLPLGACPGATAGLTA